MSPPIRRAGGTEQGLLSRRRDRSRPAHPRIPVIYDDAGLARGMLFPPAAEVGRRDRLNILGKARRPGATHHRGENHEED